LVVVPGHGDQQENAYRVARAGAGVAVKHPSDRAVLKGLTAVLTEPRFAGGAARLKAEASGVDGPARAAELVERLHGAATGRADPHVDVSGVET
jgi:UDP:flavonoid glycosyltransferase YjiC (YdhE family)